MKSNLKAVASMFCFAVVGLAAGLLGGPVASAQACDTPDPIVAAISSLALGGPEVPFPWTVKAPFPWGTIEGIWEATLDNGTQVFFSFEIQTDVGNRKILRVFELDQDNNNVLAQGTGVAAASKKLVSAAMTGQDGAYMLFIGAYRNPKTPKQDPVTVLTMRSFTSLQTPDIEVVATKVSNTPYAQ
jgi:hypothetical protein